MHAYGDCRYRLACALPASSMDLREPLPSPKTKIETRFIGAKLSKSSSELSSFIYEVPASQAPRQANGPRIPKSWPVELDDGSSDLLDDEAVEDRVS